MDAKSSMKNVSVIVMVLALILGGIAAIFVGRHNANISSQTIYSSSAGTSIEVKAGVSTEPITGVIVSQSPD